MERYLESGKSTSKMNELFVTAYVQKGGRKEEVDKVLGELVNFLSINLFSPRFRSTRNQKERIIGWYLMGCPHSFT